MFWDFSMADIITYFRSSILSAFDFLLPPRCPACQIKIPDNGHFCGTCWSDLEFISEPRCKHCGIAFEFDPGPEHICAACLADPPDVCWVRATCVYEGMARDLILRLKHGAQINLAPAMARLMAINMPDQQERVLLVPVPLHRRRFFARRYNQSMLLAQSLSNLTDVPVGARALTRIRSTGSQGGLSRKQRRRNVTGAFAANRNIVAGHHIILIDDVVTTGATADACAQTLMKAGARSVGLLVFAKVGGPRYIHM